MCRLAIKGVGSLTFDADLFRQGKVDVVVDLAERFYFLRRSRFLISKLFDGAISPSSGSGTKVTAGWYIAV